MRRILSLFLVLLWLAPSLEAKPAPATAPATMPAQEFLVIDAQVQMVDPSGVAGAPMHMTTTLAGSKARMDSNSDASAIMENGQPTIILLHQAKTYQRLPFRAPKDADAAKPLTPKATGRNTHIDGYDAQEYELDLPQGKLTLWIAIDFPDLTQIQSQLAQGMDQLNRAAGFDPHSLPGLPLRTELTQPDGTRQITTIAYRKEPAHDSLFAIPTDYQQLPDPRNP
jgi:hypothetical protein